MRSSRLFVERLLGVGFVVVPGCKHGRSVEAEHVCVGDVCLFGSMIGEESGRRVDDGSEGHSE